MSGGNKLDTGWRAIPAVDKAMAILARNQRRDVLVRWIQPLNEFPKYF
jgi:hypothetical protein